MTRVVNSFALLGDEEDDDVTVLVEHFAEKVGVTEAVAPKEKKKKPSPKQSQDSQQVSSEKGKGSEVQGQVAKEQVNGNRRKYTEGSNPNGYDNAHRGRGGYDNARRGRGAYDNAHRGRGGYDNALQGRGGYTNAHQGRGGYDNAHRVVRGGYDNAYQGHDGYSNAYRGHGRGQGQVGNRGRGRGRVNNENVTAEPKEGNRKTKEIDADGWQLVGHAHLRLNVNKTENNENASSEQLNNNEAKENVDSSGSVAKVESDVVANSEGDAAPLTVLPTEVKAEEKTPEGSVKSGGVKGDKPFKKFEKEDENLMTFEEYQKVIAKKRKALEALKNEERKVDADEAFEAMQLLAKKKEEAQLKSEATKLKKKDGLEKEEKSRKTLSINEFLKPADGKKFFYRRPGRAHVNEGASGDFKNGDRAEQGGGGFRKREPSQQGGFINNVNHAEQCEFKSKGHVGQEVGSRNRDHSQQGGRFRNRDHSQQGGFVNVNRAEHGGVLRNRDRSQQGGFVNVNRAEQGGGSRNRDRSQQGGFGNINRAEQGGVLRNLDRSQQVVFGNIIFSNQDPSQQGGFSNVKCSNLVEQGEFKSKDRAEQVGFKNRVYPEEPVIQFEDPNQFPVLKGTAPAV